MNRNLQDIRQRINLAASRSGRSPSEITLIAVAKGQPASKITEVLKEGQIDIGENYAQEFLAHISIVGAGLKPAPTWHFIGHLQRNKVKQIIKHVSLIHSVDSLALAQEIDKRAAQMGKILPILIEVHLSQEASKSGVSPDEVEELVRQMRDLPNIDLQGLMVIPPLLPANEVRPYFQRLRKIRDALNDKKTYKRPLSQLSMGMTHDFEIAIEEGATLIRVGTGIFGKRESV